MMLLVLLASLSSSVVRPPIDVDVASSSEEHVEQVVRVKVFIMEVVMVLLSVVVFRSMLIIELPLLFATQAVESLGDFLKGISSLWSSVLVRVKL